MKADWSLRSQQCKAGVSRDKDPSLTEPPQRFGACGEDPGGQRAARAVRD